MASIFSKIVDREIPAYIVAEDENYLAFLDIFPLQKGHVLVIPKVEVDYIFDLDQETYSGLMNFARQVAIKLKKVTECNRIGMVVIGLEVAHAHVHLIPINRERDMNFSNPKKEFTKEEMEAIAKMIKEA